MKLKMMHKIVFCIGMACVLMLSACTEPQWTPQACPLTPASPDVGQQFEAMKVKLATAVYDVCVQKLKEGHRRQPKSEVVLESGASRLPTMPTCVDINADGIERLILLPGVGEQRAQNILKTRQKKKFRRKKDMLKVKGIGPKAYQKMAPMICDI